MRNSDSVNGSDESLLLSCETASGAKEYLRVIDICRHGLLLPIQVDTRDTLLRHLSAALLLKDDVTISDLREALTVCEAVLYRTDVRTPMWSSAHRRLGHIHASLAHSLRMKSHDRAAVGHYRLSIAAASDDALSRATIQAQIAKSLIRIGTQESLSDAKQMLDLALEVFTEDEFPEEYGEVRTALSRLAAQAPRFDDATLLDAAENGWLEQARQSVVRGADLEARNDQGCTPLHLAVSEGYEEVAAMLVAAGASLKSVDAKGFSCLHWATFSNSAGMLELVLEEDVGVDVRDAWGRTPLTWAASEDWLVSLEWLSARGADPEIGDTDGWAALHYAAAHNRVGAARLLIALGADRNLRDSGGARPCDVARRLGFEELASAVDVAGNE